MSRCGSRSNLHEKPVSPSPARCRQGRADRSGQAPWGRHPGRPLFWRRNPSQGCLGLPFLCCGVDLGCILHHSPPLSRPGQTIFTFWEWSSSWRQQPRRGAVSFLLPPPPWQLLRRQLFPPWLFWLLQPFWLCRLSRAHAPLSQPWQSKV